MESYERGPLASLAGVPEDVAAVVEKAFVAPPMPEEQPVIRTTREEFSVSAMFEG